MKQQFTVTLNGKPMLAVQGMMLSEVVRGEMPCGGHGKCGKCKVIATGALSPLSDAERAHLSEAELARGVRLACLTSVEGDCTVLTDTEEKKKQIVTDGDLPNFDLKPTFSHYGAAIDIGTTTLAAALYDREGKRIASHSELNPQAAWGADVITRIEADLRGEGAMLTNAIRQALNEMLGALAEAAGIRSEEIDGVVITGNTVMLYLLSGVSTSPLSRAPFRADCLFGQTVVAETLKLSKLNADTPVHLPACISAFVGADITCAILSTGLTKKTRPAVLVDIGTNGEIALWKDQRLTVCSTAAGPAFEGVGISMGMNAREGAIDRVTLENGSLQAHVIGEGTPIGICGSGLVDAIACLLETEELDPSGYLEDEEITVKEPVIFTQKDIRMVQLAKSAICAGITTLIRNAKASSEELSELCVAGGFGRYLNMENAGRIGLLPSALVPVTKTVGNAALSGASMLLLNEDFRDLTVQMSRSGDTLELATNPIFMEEYTNGMLFES